MSKITETAAGRHLAGEPLTTAVALENAPGLLLNAIDRRITKVRPMSTPIDQISRIAGSRRVDSMEVGYYTVDCRPAETQTAEMVSIDSGQKTDDIGIIVTAKVADNSVLDVSDTILFPSVKTPSGNTLCGYVLEVQDGGKLRLVLPADASGRIESGAKVVRMGRAATELDVQTPQYQALPTRSTNYCQIFKMQVEQSTLMKLADKEVGWTFNEQEEAAVVDMRLGMEKNFLFGSRCRLFDTEKNEFVYLTGGIWNQAGGESLLDLSEMKPADFITFAKEVFTGNNGSRKRLLIGGSDFVAAISKLPFSDTLYIGQPSSKWGLETREIVTNFGSLFLLYSEVFDQCGHASDAMVLDQAFITKYTHIPFHPERLNLRAAGTRNTDAVVLTEASCLVLRNPGAHFRVLGV